MISTNEGYTRLEYFSEDVAADKNRKEFDIKNHTLCYTNQRPDFLFIGDSITEYWELNAYFRNSDQCEVGYMHMNDSDFQTLGAASILTKKVSEWKGETEKKWDGYHIFEEAKKGDKLCLLAIDEMVDILGEGIANICYVINPEVVVLGGGIMAQEQFLKERVECAVKRYLVSSIEEHTKIVFAKHQNDAGMLGAFYHFCSLH